MGWAEAVFQRSFVVLVFSPYWQRKLFLENGGVIRHATRPVNLWM